MATETTAAEWLQMLIDRGPALRAAGVRRVEIGGCVADLEPEPIAFPDQVREDDNPAGIVDPLDDPDLYGGRVPSLRGDQ